MSNMAVLFPQKMFGWAAAGGEERNMNECYLSK